MSGLGDVNFYTNDGPCSLLIRIVWAAFLSLAIGTQNVGAQPDSLDQRFTAANEAYAQGQYGRSVEAYHDVLRSGYESGALFYNLGNAYARLDQWGQAIRYYEKARRLRPADSRVQHNLKQVRRQAGIESERAAEGFRDGVGAVIHDWSPTAIFILGWLLLVGGLARGLFWVRSETGTQFQHPLAWGPIGTGLLAVGIALGTSYVQSMSEDAVVVADKAPVRVAPNPEATADTTLREGTMLRVTSRRDQWHEVRLSEDSKGWVPARAVGDI